MARPLSRLLALALALAPLSAGAQAPRLAVLPIAWYNAPEVEPLAPGLRAMLASRLAAGGRRVHTLDAPGPGEWSVHTAITRLGQTYSVDVALEPGIARAFETARSPEELLEAIDAVAAHLRKHLDEPRPAASPAPPAEAPPQRTPDAAPAAASPTLPPAGFQRHRSTPPLPGAATSLAAADLDGEGNLEILVLVEEELVAYRDGTGGLVPAWRSPTPRGIDALTLSVGDLDGNGRPEVFVAGMDGTRLVTQALEWSGTGLAPKGKRLDAWLRAVPVPGGAPALRGLRGGVGRDLAAPGLRRFAWADDGYRDDGPAEEPAAAGPVNLDFATLDPGGRPFALVTGQNDRLRLYDPDGTLLVESPDPIKGSPLILRGQERLPGYQDEDRLVVHGRTAVWHAPGGGALILTARNEAGSSRIFRRSAQYSHGQIVAWRWDGLSLIPAGESPKLPGYLPDLLLAPGPHGGQTLYAALVQSEGTVFPKTSTRLVAFDLSAP